MDSGRRILVVEDDQDVRSLVVRCLTGAGFAVVETGTGAEALAAALRDPPDLVVIDLGLPDADGLAITRTLKERTDCGLVILSGRGDAIERIIGLEIGADDYVSKPFEPRELVARVRSVLRRIRPPAPVVVGDVAPLTPAPGQAPAAAPAGSPALEFEGWTLIPDARRLLRPDGRDEELTTGEFNLLHALAERPGRVLSRDQLLDLTHGDHAPAFDRSVDVQIGRLRRKIERDPAEPTIVKTVRNAGYMFTAPVRRRG
jgi:two-component system OmpR family response regulator